MLHRSLLLGLSALFALALVAYCETPPASTPSTPEATKTQAMTKPPAPATAQQMGMPQGYQPDEDWTYYVDEPQTHFQMAREAAAKKDMMAAADQMRRGAAFMRLEAMRADMESKQVIMMSSKEVDALADRMQQGLGGAEDQIDATLAHANEVMARSHYKMATEAYAKNDMKAAGRELRAADTDIDNGMKWIGKSWTETTAATKMTAREVANEMAKNAKVAQDDAKRALDETRKGIDALGKDLQSYGKHAQNPSQETVPKVDPAPGSGK